MLVGVKAAVVAVVKVLLWAGVVVDIVVELLVIDVWTNAVIEPFGNVVTGVVLVLDFIATVSYFENVFEVLTVGIGIDVLTDVDTNVSAAVTTALEFPMRMP